MTDTDALARAIRVLIADAAPVLRDGGTPIDRQNLAAAIEQAAEAADREAASDAARAIRGLDSADADPLDVEALAAALEAVYAEKWNRVGPLPKVPVTVFGGYAEDIAAAYAAVKEAKG